MDVHDKKTRSFNMSRIRNKNTIPELRVRSMVHKLGYRFRLHSKTLPGKPDLVLQRHKIVLFVNGCFWHRHTCRNGQHFPKTNVDFWSEKFTNTKIRDHRNYARLRADGWFIGIIWECETREQQELIGRIERLLKPNCNK